MHAHDPGRFDEQLADATALMTPSYAERFSSSQRERKRLFDTLRAPVALEHVDGTGLVAGDGDKATVFLVGRVVEHAVRSRDEKTLHTAELLHLVRDGSRWLVAKVDMETEIEPTEIEAKPSDTFEEARAVGKELVELLADGNGSDGEVDGARLGKLAIDSETAERWRLLDTQLTFNGRAVVTAIEELSADEARVLVYVEGDRSDGTQGPLGVWRCSLVRSHGAWKSTALELA